MAPINNFKAAFGVLILLLLFLFVLAWLVYEFKK